VKEVGVPTNGRYSDQTVVGLPDQVFISESGLVSRSTAPLEFQTL